MNLILKTMKYNVISKFKNNENIISKFKNTQGWSKDINFNIGVKQRCHLSPSLFGIYIEKLEDCLEEPGCVIPTLIFIFINLLLYPDDIVLMVRSPHDIGKQLRILKDFCSNMGMTVNILIRLRSRLLNPIRSLMIPLYMTTTTWRK